MEDLHEDQKNTSVKNKNVHLFSPKNADITATVKFETLNKLNRFMPHVSGNEFCVLHFIWSRTIYWGKSQEFICARHFLKGIPNVIEPLNSSSRSLSRSLSSLVEKGILLRVHHEHSGSSYAINFKWEPVIMKAPKSSKPKNTGGLKTPKRLAEKTEENGVAKLATGVAKLARGGSQIGEHKYDNNKLDNNKYDKEVSASALTDILPTKNKKEEVEKIKKAAEDFIGRAVIRSREARERKLTKAAERETVADLERLWREEIRIVHPDYPPPCWSAKERGQMKNFRNDFHAEPEPKRVLPFLKFCIENWNRIMTCRFRFRKNFSCPEFPDLGFIMAFKKDFLFVYGDENFESKNLGLTYFDQQVRALKKRGYTTAQAEKAVRERSAKKVDDTVEAELKALKERVRYECAEKEKKIQEVKQLERERAREAAKRYKEKLKQQKLEEEKPPIQKRELDADGYPVFQDNFGPFGDFDDE